jgi:predicted small lipoprotein YifL
MNLKSRNLLGVPTAFMLVFSLAACGGEGVTTPASEGTNPGTGESTSDSGSTTTTDLATVDGCDGTVLLAADSDVTSKGPWDVGARTLLAGELTAEVWYPALPGSRGDSEAIIYDIRDQLAPEEGVKIPDEDNPWHYCDCYRDLPLDTERGRYPVIIFAHGTAGFRHQSLAQMTHWASHGFVVAAVDHPGLKLGDLLAFNFDQDLATDINTLYSALESATGDWAFLEGHIDLQRLGAAGHSAGGGAISALTDRAQVLIPMASRGTSESETLQSTLILGGVADGVADYSGQVNGYESSPTTKRLIGLENAGHLAFSDLCNLGADKGGLVEIATQYGVTGASFASFLWDGCDEGQLPFETARDITNYATTIVLKETLHCDDTRSTLLPDIASKFDAVYEYREEL